MASHRGLTDTRISSNAGDPNTVLTILATAGFQIIYDNTNNYLYVGSSADNGTNNNWTVL